MASLDQGIQTPNVLSSITVSHLSLSNKAARARSLAKGRPLDYVRARSTGLLSREDQGRNRRSSNESFGTVGGYRPARCILFLAANGLENARDGIRLRGRFGQKTPGPNPVAGKNVT